MADWGALGRSRDIKALFESREARAYHDEAVTELLKGPGCDQLRIGLLRGRVEALEWIQNLPARQAKLKTRVTIDGARRDEAGAVSRIAESLRP